MTVRDLTFVAESAKGLRNRVGSVLISRDSEDGSGAANKDSAGAT